MMSDCPKSAKLHRTPNSTAHIAPCLSMKALASGDEDPPSERCLSSIGLVFLGWCWKHVVVADFLAPGSLDPNPKTGHLPPRRTGILAACRWTKKLNTKSATSETSPTYVSESYVSSNTRKEVPGHTFFVYIHVCICIHNICYVFLIMITNIIMIVVAVIINSIVVIMIIVVVIGSVNK